MPSDSGFELMRQFLEREEERLRLDLADIRSRYEHAGNKGESAEHILREFLSRYLSAYNRVGHGEVFNIDGLRSRQTDIVVTNEYHVGLRSDWSDPQTFFIESVECAGEVKTNIKDRGDLRDIFDKARAFKSMFMEPDQGMQFRAHEEDIPRFIWRRPFFGFAFESELSLSTTIRELGSWTDELRQVERPVLDSLFILDRGVTVHMGQGDGYLRSSVGDGEPQAGYVQVRQGDQEVLAHFLLWIYAAMPRIDYHTHPALVYLRSDPEKGKLRLDDDGYLARPVKGEGSVQ